MNHRDTFKKVFKKELTEINDESIRDFVLLCVELSCPDYFWTIPASQSGKYHSDISNGPGGLIRHTKLAFQWAKELIRVWELTVSQQDEVKAAVLLHDMMKLGTDCNSPPARSTQIHGLLLVNNILSKLPKDFVLAPAQHSILNAIASHMGRWTEPCLIGATCVTSVVHLADYVASRKIDHGDIVYDPKVQV